MGEWFQLSQLSIKLIVILTLHFSPMKDPMERDLRKTLPNHKLFRDVRKREYVSDDCNEEEKSGISTSSRGSNYGGEEMGKKALRRILRAYSVYDEELGYCRGMSFIVSKMNTLFSSEQYIDRATLTTCLFRLPCS